MLSLLPRAGGSLATESSPNPGGMELITQLVEGLFQEVGHPTGPGIRAGQRRARLAGGRQIAGEKDGRDPLPPPARQGSKVAMR
jgi:hypothetical protein